MQYQVPQFIEVEDKIFGPLTFKQFAYVAGAGGACLLFFTFLPLWLAAILAIPFVALGLALAFYKVNDQPFIIALEHALKYYTGGKLYLWKQRQAEVAAEAEFKTVQRPVPLAPKISESKLKDLAWSLNIKDWENAGGRGQPPAGLEL